VGVREGTQEKVMEEEKKGARSTTAQKEYVKMTTENFFSRPKGCGKQDTQTGSCAETTIDRNCGGCARSSIFTSTANIECHHHSIATKYTSR
jgi:hypothetical protein